ncbi:PAF acetylhydrolase [Cordyceps fumosorosea ARSEF 2679]|uniref:Putative phospholipase n=1 Tax=Cordyceps fumosorosea (strain ARSEF 2679) TaxID=1081104 RepID=A0A167WK98_CORFA|nr:PAF acetylhydrolase [Cordyceps fumosorosea ARSEF 2679]OAA63898.1 PAF acetylhydrolase [Cordyceps fumosorosea ARSEF 2679]
MPRRRDSSLAAAELGVQVELEPFHDDSFPLASPTSSSSSSSSPDDHDHPDSPLLQPTSSTQPSASSAVPKWLSPPPYASRRGAARHLLHLAHILRPRRSWRCLAFHLVALYALVCVLRGEPFFASNLPTGHRYGGAPEAAPYDVGTVDLEVPLIEPRRLSETALKASGQPAFVLESVLFSLYYPVARGARAAAGTSPHLWVPRPVSLTAAGLARLAHADYFFVRPILTFLLWAVAGRIEIPAKVDAPLLQLMATAPGHNDTAGLPVVVFSHGMASSRTDYTAYLSALAARGVVVAALEHRDGSCPGTSVRVRGKPDRDVLHFDTRHVLSTPPMDAPAMKREQLAFREAEIREAVKALGAINDGHGRQVYDQNSRSEGTTLQEWTGRLDLSRLVIAGHSYGATGALQALRPDSWSASSSSSSSSDSSSDSESASAVAPAAGVILDPGKSSGPLNADVDVPLLVVNSEAWSRGPSPFFGRPHFGTVRDLVADALNRTAAAWFLTARGTAHPSVTDAPLLEPLLLSAVTGARLDARAALAQYVNATAEFLDAVLPTGASPSHLLAEGVTHEEYGTWVSEEREEAFPNELARLWEVHVAP